jgi:hypothetical protein
MRPRGAVRAALCALVTLAAACTDSGTSTPTEPTFDDPITTPAPTTATTAAATAEPTSTEAVTTTAETATSTPAIGTETTPTDPPESISTTSSTTTVVVTTEPGLTGPTFSDALGVKVESAPGVNTPGDTRELMPGLWVHLAWQADPNDPSVFTVQPGDEPILEAYANSMLVYFRSATTTVDLTDPAWSTYFIDHGEQYRQIFDERRASGQVRDLDLGVVLRPYVLGDQRTPASAVVLDWPAIDGWSTSLLTTNERACDAGCISGCVFDGADHTSTGVRGRRPRR